MLVAASVEPSSPTQLLYDLGRGDFTRSGSLPAPLVLTASTATFLLQRRKACIKIVEDLSLVDKHHPISREKCASSELHTLPTSYTAYAGVIKVCSAMLR